MPDVFISYKREDRPFAQSLARALEAYDLRVWWDHELEAGDAFRQVIQAKLDAADAVIVLWSRASTQSAFVLDEAGRGLARSVLVPVAIDDAPTPLGFGQTHTLDLKSWGGDAADARVRAIASACARAAPAGPGAIAARGVKFGRLSFWASTGIAALVGAAAGAMIGFEDAAQGQTMGPPGVFWLVHMLAGIVMVGGALLAARWLFAWAQRLAGARARGFFDAPFLILCCGAFASSAAAAIALRDKQVVTVIVLMGALACLCLALAAAPAGALWKAVRGAPRAADGRRPTTS
jgi:hypothetical protein